MSSTDGIQRGMEVENLGRPISVPVGDVTLGRVFNLLGDNIDLDEQLPADTRRDPIHRDSPKFENLSTETEILETGIKVVDLLAPYIKGGKIGLFGGAGVGKTRSEERRVGKEWKYKGGQQELKTTKRRMSKAATV